MTLIAGCNGLPLTSPRGYSAVQTGDVHIALASMRARYPRAPLMAVGYSLGSVLLTKYVAEADVGAFGSGGSGLVAVALVSNPVCLHATNSRLGTANSFDVSGAAPGVSANCVHAHAASRHLPAPLIPTKGGHAHFDPQVLLPPACMGMCDSDTHTDMLHHHALPAHAYYQVCLQPCHRLQASRVCAAPHGVSKTAGNGLQCSWQPWRLDHSGI